MRRTALAAGGAALAIALAGCSGGGANTMAGNPQPLFDNPQKLVQAASTETSKKNSAKFSMKVAIGDQSFNADGAGKFGGENPAMKMTMKAMGKKVQMRFVDNALYVKKPNTSSGSSAGKPWKKITPDSGSNLSKQLSKFGERSDPSAALERIKKAGTITKSEKTQLNGQQVSHYWIDLDFAKIAENYEDQIPEQFMDKMQGKLQGVKLPMQLWLNSDNLPVKMTVQMSELMKSMAEAMQSNMPEQVPQSAIQKMKSMKMSITMNYHDWGSPVDVTAPPAGKVATE